MPRRRPSAQRPGSLCPRSTLPRRAGSLRCCRGSGFLRTRTPPGRIGVDMRKARRRDGLWGSGAGSALLGSDVLAPRGQGVFAGPACRHAGPLPRIPAVQGEERGVAELVSRVDGLGVAVAVVVVLVDVRSLA